MREILYKSFSRQTREKNLRLARANLCQFELTFRCHFHCPYCFNSCYNHPNFLKRELDTDEVKIILDKLQEAGIIWLCFTGGDPLTRPNFLDIYSYAKEKGFIITVFTNSYSITKNIIQCFKEKPPFVLEITLNAVTEGLFEEISGVKGSFRKVMQAIEFILKEKIPLTLKTQVTKYNLEEVPKIKRFLRKRGLKFFPDHMLYPKLNGDLTPCRFRISPPEVLNLYRRKTYTCTATENNPGQLMQQPCLFPCAIDAGDGINIDPYGNVFLCELMREPKFNLLKVDVHYVRNELLFFVRNRKFSTNSRCKSCGLKAHCQWCPGIAYLEKKNAQESVEYCCELAELDSIS